MSDIFICFLNFGNGVMLFVPDWGDPSLSKIVGQIILMPVTVFTFLSVGVEKREV